MSEIVLKVTLDEANLVLESLGNQPFVKVHELIGKIHQQAQRQVEPVSDTQKAQPANVENIADAEQAAKNAKTGTQ